MNEKTETLFYKESSSTRLSESLSLSRLFPARQPFYDSYPYSGGLSRRSADARGCVDLELDFFCNRVPKAANSSVVASLASLKLQRQVGSREAKHLFKRPSDLSRDEMLVFSKLLKFTIVRNPYARTLSAFLDKVKRKQEIGSWRGKEHDFYSFLLWLEQGKLLDNAHWAPQTSILLLPVAEFDFVGRVESLDRDLNYILRRLNGSAEGADINPVFSNATGAEEKLASFYCEKTANLVEKLYHRDFELLGYSKDLLTRI